MGGCFPCLGSSTKGVNWVKEVANESFKDGSAAQPTNVNKLSTDKSKSRSNNDSKKEPTVAKDGPTANIPAQTFTFRELATATKNFRSECLLGEGGFGRVYKGQLESTGQVVAVKQLDRNGLQGNRERNQLEPKKNLKRERQEKLAQRLLEVLLMKPVAQPPNYGQDVEQQKGSVHPTSVSCSFVIPVSAGL